MLRGTFIGSGATGLAGVNAASGQGGGAFALDFPSNVSGSSQVSAYGVIEFVNPQSDGLPIWGPSNAGVTVIRKVKFKQQTGYYAPFWWSQGDGEFNGSNGYWGFGPYPQNESNTGTTHWHEIATGGGDFIDANGAGPGSGSPTTVTMGATYVQAMVVSRQSANQKTLRYYFNLPNVDTSNYVQRVETLSNYGESSPPSPKVTQGNSPWMAGFQEERGSFTLDWEHIYARALSEAELLTVIAAPQVALSGIWWGKNGFNSVDDLTCAFGTGRSFTRNDSNNILSTAARF